MIARSNRPFTPLLFAALGAVLVNSALTGQDPARNRIVAITAGSSSKAAQMLRQTMDGSACKVDTCQLTGFEVASSGLAGGCAFNGDVPPNLTGSVGGIWISNGRQLAAVDPFTCSFRCKPQAAPLVDKTSVVTGLACFEQEAALFMTDSANRLYWVSTTKGCTLKAVACSTWSSKVPKGYVAGGLASDDLGRRLFVSVSNFGKTPVDNRILVAGIGFPKKPVQTSWCNFTNACLVSQIPVPKGRSLGAITGLAFDACTSTLYYTDGRLTVGAKVSYLAGGCQLTLTNSCAAPTGETISGLCIEQKRSFLVGKSCVSKPCVDCPKMLASTFGDPFLGNRNFALTLNNAPTGSSPVLLAVGFGGCLTAGPRLGFCGDVRVPFAVPPLLLPLRLPPTGTGPCDGKLVVSFTVPPWPRICGYPLSAQFAMECVGPKGARGKTLSNCVTFEFTTN